MIEWLQKIYNNPRFFKYGILVLIFIIVLVIFEAIALISDLGFAEEIKQYRWRIIFFVFIGCSLIAFIYDYKQIRVERDKLKSNVDKLTLDKSDLEQQQESLFRLMEAYRLEAQGNIFNRLKQLAIFSIKREKWLEKAKIERFRIEELSKNNHEQIKIVDCTTVIINLGIQDDAMKGMQFIIQDPTDAKKYGVIRVEECFENGSSCSIIEMNHPAFWSGIETVITSEEKKESIIEAPANVLVPHTPFKELNTKSAKQLLEWIQNLEDVEL